MAESVGGTLVASDGAVVLRGLAEGAGTGVPAAMVGYRSGLPAIEVSARGAAVSAGVPSVGLREGRGAAVPVSGGRVRGSSGRLDRHSAGRKRAWRRRPRGHGLAAGILSRRGPPGVGEGHQQDRPGHQERRGEVSAGGGLHRDGEA